MASWWPARWTRTESGDARQMQAVILVSSFLSSGGLRSILQQVWTGTRLKAYQWFGVSLSLWVGQINQQWNCHDRATSDQNTNFRSWSAACRNWCWNPYWNQLWPFGSSSGLIRSLMSAFHLYLWQMQMQGILHPTSYNPTSKKHQHPTIPVKMMVAWWYRSNHRYAILIFRYR